MAAADSSQRINAERILLIAWVRAILLQVAHPLIAAGVAEHSSFRGGSGAALSRLHQTVGAMLTITFGAPADRERALDGIRAIHRRVNGVLAVRRGIFDAGTRYSAEDPALLLWVHATLVESIVLAYEQLVAPLTPGARDRYCADSADVAVELGAPADEVARSWAALRAYMDGMYASGRIVVADQARTLAGALLSPFPAAIGRRIITPVLSLVAAGQLPAGVRAQYEFRWNEARARRFAVMMALLRLLRRGMPRRVAWWKAARSQDCFTARHGLSATAR